MLDSFLILGQVNVTKRALFIDSLALLFHVTLPGISDKHIQGKWECRGLLPRPSLETLMSICPGVWTAEMHDVFLEHETEMISFFIEHGFVSDTLLDKYFPPSKFNLDDATLRSQRMVICTHLSTIKRVLERRDRPRLRREQKLQKEKEAQEKKEQQAKVCCLETVNRCIISIC